MKKTTIEDWNIIRPEPIKPYLTHSIYESDDSKFAFYFSQIEEWGIMKMCTKLQIFRNKINPQKIFDSGSAWFLYDMFVEDDFKKTNFVYDWTPEGLVCFRRLINGGHNDYYYPFVIIDLHDLLYAIIDDNSLVTLSKIDSNAIEVDKIVFDEKSNRRIEPFKYVHLNKMNWMPLSQFKDS